MYGNVQYYSVLVLSSSLNQSPAADAIFQLHMRGRGGINWLAVVWRERNK